MFELQAADGAARAGFVVTPRGRIRTPCFMPVGSRGAVRLLSADDLDHLGAEVVLANTYHLMLRPGAKVVEALGGLHGFSGWQGHFLTDSGGYQVMSLPCSVDDKGVDFRSAYDGSSQRLTPEDAVRAQEALGSDIAMVLDVCVALPAPRSAVEEAGERTLAWAGRSLAARSRPDQLLFGIVQGGTEPDLRERYAERLGQMGFDGYGIGGLSVGEAPAETLAALSRAIAPLPVARPRYLMGVGDPYLLVRAVGLGVDMFDCVLPTRLGRHGTALTAAGKVAVKAARYGADAGPVDPTCACPVCRRHSRGYLRHLFNVGEPSAGRLLSLHNLAWLLALAGRAREAVLAGTFGELEAEVAARWAPERAALRSAGPSG
ncbi:MAG: tRNA guanosine(34) transglycosylase Tgt [Acidimicrobiales bacterium]|jgi:queuine tRNA-ribosyltransferase